MKKYLAAAVLIVLAGAATAQAGVDFSVNIGVPVVVAPPPVATVVTYPAYAPQVAYPDYGQRVTYPSYGQQVAYAGQPGFIYSPRLGFYVSVGLPYDVVYLDNSYYHYRGGRWYTSPSYGGGWSYISQQRLPHALHRHRYEQITYYRDREFKRYERDRDHYRGQWYRPAGMHRDHRWDDRGIDRRDGRTDRRDGYRDRDRGNDGDHGRGRR